MIELDGTYGEGGGSLLRCALALSTLTGKPFKINNIRANRPKGGLKAQHLTSINALKEMSSAKTSEIELGSTEMWFHPGIIKSGTYTLDIGTAGSITLALQSLILPCLFAPGKITLEIHGGTCGKWQASVEYLQHLLLPQLARFVQKIDVKILKRGYYPKGGGKIIVEITPKIKQKSFSTFEEFFDAVSKEIKPVRLFTQGDLEQIRGIIHLSEDLHERDIGHRIVQSAKSSLAQCTAPINIAVESQNTLSSGGELILWSIHSISGEVDMTNPVRLSGDALLDQRKSAQDVGKEAAEELLNEINSKSAADSFLADQLILYMSMLPASIIKTSKITNHTTTNLYVAEQFLEVTFSIDENVIKVEKKQ
jgi:RNA 3'-phosphate cyclase